MIQTAQRGILLCLLFLLVACTPALTGQPRWVHQPQLGYPADRYLVGSATGETCDDAVDLAIARIAQQIEVRVNASEQRRSLYNAINAASGAESTEIETDVRLTTDATLLGVEIVESLPLPNGSCAARAVLDFDRSIALYDAAIAQRESSIGTALNRAGTARSPWMEFVSVSEAMRIAIERDVLAMTRGVLASRGGRNAQTDPNVAPALIDRYESLRDQISLSVVRVGGCPESLVEAAESVLVERGLPLERDHPGSIQLRVSWFAEVEQTYDPRWWACKWRLSVTLIDADRNETIASHSPAASTAYGLSREAAITQSQSDAATPLANAIEIVLQRPGAFTPW